MARREIAFGRPHTRLVTTAEGDMRAFLERGLDRRAADAGRAARDDESAIGEAEIHLRFRCYFGIGRRRCRTRNRRLETKLRASGA